MCCRGRVKELKNKQRSITYSNCKISNNLKHGRKVEYYTGVKIVRVIVVHNWRSSILLWALMVLFPCT